MAQNESVTTASSAIKRDAERTCWRQSAPQSSGSRTTDAQRVDDPNSNHHRRRTTRRRPSPPSPAETTARRGGAGGAGAESSVNSWSNRPLWYLSTPLFPAPHALATRSSMCCTILSRSRTAASTSSKRKVSLSSMASKDRSASSRDFPVSVSWALVGTCEPDGHFRWNQSDWLCLPCRHTTSSKSPGRPQCWHRTGGAASIIATTVQ
mmetsp:Transcript_35582/g.100184  ORF Transcript_35582/g.100184 Transcript_35582/m.100184 type:complete len:208 (-) Transcript_35582:348-971(-)